MQSPLKAAVDAFVGVCVIEYHRMNASAQLHHSTRSDLFVSVYTSVESFSLFSEVSQTVTSRYLSVYAFYNSFQRLRYQSVARCRVNDFFAYFWKRALAHEVNKSTSFSSFLVALRFDFYLNVAFENDRFDDFLNASS